MNLLGCPSRALALALHVLPIVETAKAGMGSRTGVPSPPLANSAGSRMLVFAKVSVAEGQLGTSDVKVKFWR